jgi:hypothetical protein
LATINHPEAQWFDPPLEPEESLEVYFAATQKLEHENHARMNRHAFAVLIYRSSGNPPMEIIYQSRSLETHAQRGNLGALLTIFECLTLNEAEDHEVNIYTAEQYILGLPHRVGAWIEDRKKRSVRDLYEKLLPYVSNGAWPRVHLIRQPKGGLHGQRRKGALGLANDELSRLFPPIE